jgi:hypothetical protein
MKQKLETQIQNKFKNFKKAEQDFFKVLSKIEDEDKMISVMTKLKEIDNRIQIIKQPKQELSYIG